MQTEYRGDHREFFSFLRRIMGALARRIGNSDPEDLREMVKLKAELDDILVQAVALQRANGASWREIATALGVAPSQAIERYDPEVRARRLERDRLRAAGGRVSQFGRPTAPF
jgi:hypothetical protein